MQPLPIAAKAMKPARTLWPKGGCAGKPGAPVACIKKERPLALKQALDSPSVISYLVEVELRATPVIKPAGAAVGCWPAD